MTYLLDSNIFVSRLNGNERIRRHLSGLLPSQIVLCAPVLAELRFGAEFSQRRDDNLKRLEGLARALRKVDFDLAAAERFGVLKAQLRRQGIAKSDFDLSIAAISLEIDATLVSNDRAFHDATIPGLRVEDWTKAQP